MNKSCKYIVSLLAVFMLLMFVPAYAEALLLEEGEILIPAGVYSDTSTYDSVAPYTAYENGKKALEAENPNGYAMLASSAKRGCNQARIYLAQVFTPAKSDLNKVKICIVPENEYGPMDVTATPFISD